MKFRLLNLIELNKHKDEVYSCYKANKFIFDDQSPIRLNNAEECRNFIYKFISCYDSMVFGIYDDNSDYLYGVVIFDNIRALDVSCAEVHIAVDKPVWGRITRTVFEEMIKSVPIDIMYCQIPLIAVNAIALVKRLGFKKTGYIPKALPYTNSKGEKKLYDLNIFVLNKG